VQYTYRVLQNLRIMQGAKSVAQYTLVNHATLDTLHFQPDAKILKNPVSGLQYNAFH